VSYTAWPFFIRSAQWNADATLPGNPEGFPGLPSSQRLVIGTTSGPLLSFSDHVIADIARTWRICDSAAFADLKYFAGRRGDTAESTKRLILRSVAYELLDEAMREQPVQGHRGLVRPVFVLQGEDFDRWARQRLKRLGLRWLTGSFPMLVDVEVDSLSSAAPIGQLAEETRAERAASEVQTDPLNAEVTWLRANRYGATRDRRRLA
jgi:hypothetical protein